MRPWKFECLNCCRRYHQEEEQKYGHLQPGQLSKRLREALGLEEHDIPAHVYHMRRVGYPMGWLEAARCTASELSLYDFEGRRDASGADPASPIDPDKLVEYPGFNAPCPEDARDLHARHGCPPYSEQHSVHAMLQHLRRQHVSEPAAVRRVASPLPPDSPSLGELERQKAQLLDLLNNGVTSHSPAQRVPLEQAEQQTPPSTVRCSLFGTPLLQACSPYQRLPHPDNFSVGVSQVINFENLPDATGKYEQMTGVLSKVRKTIRYSAADVS